MKMSNDFPTILNCYFSKHLKLERRFSSNTYISYLTVLKQYIHFLNSELNISNKKISITDFEKNNIISFLNYAETTLKVSPRTRNHKLTVLNSFLEYAQSINPVYIELYLASKSIKLKRVKKEKMDFMTVEELKAFFECIDLKHKTGYKHYVMLTTLYETATRVSELINIQTTDFGRIRVGIGQPEYKNDMVNYVIGKVPEEEQKILEEGVNKAVEAVEEILKKGIDIAMNKFN